MKLVHRFLLWGMFVILLSGLPACANTSTITQPPIKSIRVVMDNNYPPYVFQDAEGHVQGILIDQWQLWEEKTGVKVEITALPWGEALEAMRSGQFDVIDTIFYTEERAQVFDFTDPYANIDVHIFFNNNVSGLAQVSDLKGFRVAVKSGDANAEYLIEQGITDLVYYNSYEEIVRAAVANNEAVFVMDQSPALYYLYKFNAQGDFRYSKPLYGGQFHRAVLKEHTDMLKLVTDGFSRISPSEYTVIDNHWFGNANFIEIKKYTPFVWGVLALGGIALFTLFIFNLILRIRVHHRTHELQQALQDLQKSEARFREAIEFLPIPISIADEAGRILIVNRKFTENYGYILQDMPTIDKWLSLAYPDPQYREKVLAVWNKDVAESVESGEATPIREYQVTCQDGSKRDVEIVMHPISGLWVASFNNITERKIAEARLRESELIFSSFLEHSPIFVFFKDKDIRSIRLSRNYEQMLGIPVEDALGKSMDELFPSDLAKSMVADDLRILNEGKRIDIVEEFDNHIYETTKFPIYIDGKPEMLAGFTMDVTERKLTEQALRESEENYRHLVELSPDAIIVHRDGNIIFANTASVRLMHAQDVSEIIGKPAMSFVHPDSRTDVAVRIQHMLTQSERVPPIEEKFICLDGEVVDVEVVAMPVTYEGKPAIQVVARDITERKKMMDELIASEEKYRTLIETINTGIFMSTLDGRFIQANSAVVEISGYDSIEEFLTLPAQKLYADIRDREMITAQLMAEGLIKNAEVRSVKKDGTVYWISISAVLLKDATGKPTALLGSVTDITERKNTEDIIQKNEKRWRTLIEKSADALTLLKSDGSILYEGPTVQRLTGYTPEERFGRSALENIIPEDLPMVRQILSTIMDSPGSSTTLEFRSTRKDGSFWWVEGTATNLLQDPNVQAVVVNYRDITARKNADEELQNSENRFRILFEHAGMGVAQSDSMTGQLLRVNQKYCEIVGYPREELESLKFQDITYPDDLQADLSNMERLRAGDISEFQMEKRYIRKDGTLVWVVLVVSPLWAPGEPPSTHIAVVHDITEQKRAEYSLRYSEAEVRKLNAELEVRVAERTAQLESTNKELEAFAYSVSHDLRAPLRAIDGFSRIFLDGYADQLDDEGRSLLGRVRQANQNMTQLVDALLGLSRMSRAELHYDTINLSTLADSIIDDLKHSFPDRPVTYQVEDGLFAEGDIRLLRVVLENLLSNAWKFTTRQENPIVEFGSVKVENETAYYVRDNGAGFNMNYANKLFGAFQRLHAASEFEGTGIGLATVQRIIHRHGGRVWAESEVDKGATFYFTLGKPSV